MIIMEVIKRIFAATTATVSPKMIVKECLKIDGVTMQVSMEHCTTP